ncbi:arylsulfotransferase family protein [Cytophaga aurantiaca]|uniref:arylsulfotransferase family protein n=1 Tax=Cytophaga aurantiaca TaxID=29530 RepID=UPI00039FC376|nr:arylsulfotransferase family protein [Cytophaga aurantiaca]
MKSSINKIVQRASLVVVCLFALSYFSNMVYNAAIDGRKSGLLAGYLTDFSQFPDLITKTLTSDELAGIPPTYTKADSSFQEVNKLTYPVYALNSFWDAAKEEWEIRLFNLKNDSTSFQWRLSQKNLDMSTTSWFFPNTSPRNCIILPNKSLLVSADESANLVRLDSNSHILWSNHEFIYHHSLELDADSNVWVCGSALNTNGKITLQAVKNFESIIFKYKENYIIQIDSKTGKILFQKGITEILRDNHYSNFVFGFSNPNAFANDPIHLNDIQPVLTDSPYWKKGDVFISIRHRSLVFLYRPSTNKIIRLIFGEFINQHDVDVISDSEIAIFNNNFIQRVKDKPDAPEDTFRISNTMNSSEIVVYNFKDSTFKTLLKDHFINEKIQTKTQGGFTFLKNNNIFVESQNQGKLFIVNDSGVVLKKILHVPSSPFIYQLNWIRIYEQLPY